MAVTMETLTGPQEEEVAPAAAAAGMAAPTAAPEAEKEAWAVVATLGAADPPARGVVGRADTVTPKAMATEGTGTTRREAPTKLKAPAPWKTPAPRKISTRARNHCRGRQQASGPFFSGRSILC